MAISGYDASSHLDCTSVWISYQELLSVPGLVQWHRPSMSQLCFLGVTLRLSAWTGDFWIYTTDPERPAVLWQCGVGQ